MLGYLAFALHIALIFALDFALKFTFLQKGKNRIYAKKKAAYMQKRTCVYADKKLAYMQDCDVTIASGGTSIAFPRVASTEPCHQQRRYRTRPKLILKKTSG